MAPSLLYDLSTVDMNKIVVPIEGIRETIPQRFEMEMLSGIVHIDLPNDVIIKAIEITDHEFGFRNISPAGPSCPAS